MPLFANLFVVIVALVHIIIWALLNENMNEIPTSRLQADSALSRY
jgi:hypothetical protein